MKTTLLLTLLIAPFVAKGQGTLQPFKDANAILIETGLSATEAFVKWGRHLAQNGYPIDNSDNTFYTVKTGPKDTSKGNYDFVVISSVSDSGTIMITLKSRLKSSDESRPEPQFYDWHYAPGKASARNLIYREFLPTIESFGHFDVFYEKK